jgi:hypothetical protein
MMLFSMLWLGWIIRKARDEDVARVLSGEESGFSRGRCLKLGEPTMEMMLECERFRVIYKPTNQQLNSLVSNQKVQTDIEDNLV